MKKLLFIFILPILLLAGCTSAAPSEAKEQAKTLVDSALMVEQVNHDFGTISMKDGIVSTNVTVRNNGDTDVVVKKLYSSCMCTTANITTEGVTSRRVGMPGHGDNNEIYQIVPARDSADVAVYYDPNAHGPMGTGVNRRSVFLETNSNVAPQLQFDFVVNVTR